MDNLNTHNLAIPLQSLCTGGGQAIGLQAPNPLHAQRQKLAEYSRDRNLALSRAALDERIPDLKSFRAKINAAVVGEILSLHQCLGSSLPRHAKKWRQSTRDIAEKNRTCRFHQLGAITDY